MISRMISFRRLETTRELGILVWKAFLTEIKSNYLFLLISLLHQHKLIDNNLIIYYLGLLIITD